MFLQEVEKVDIECLSSVPLLLKLLICLWEKDHELADTQTGIYSAIVSKLCCLTTERKSDNGKFQRWLSQLADNECTFQRSLNNDLVLQKFSTLIYALGKFSFESLFNKNQCEALVFKDKDLTDQGISEAEYELALQIGLLSKKKVIGNSKMCRVRCISFIHKTFQEYFAALYASMFFEKHKTIEAKLQNIFTSSENIMGVLKVVIFIKEMSSDVFDQITTEIEISENDFKMSVQKGTLCLQTNMKSNTKQIIELVMATHIREILIKFSNFGKHKLQFPTIMKYVTKVEFDTVQMTPFAFKQILENLPETPGGVSLKICSVNVRTTQSWNDTFCVSVTLNNIKSIEIDFMNMCGIVVKFSKHMKTVNLVKFHEVEMDTKELEQLLSSLPDTDHGIDVTLSSIYFKNEVDEDRHSLIQMIKRNRKFEKIVFKPKHLRRVTFCWSGKKFSCTYIGLSEAAENEDNLLAFLEKVTKVGDYATVVQIKAEESLRTYQQHHDSGFAVILLGFTMKAVNSLRLVNIKVTDMGLCEIMKHVRLEQLESIQLDNITIAQTSNNMMQLNFKCVELNIQRTHILSNMSVLCSRAVHSLSLSDVTLTSSCCHELLKAANHEFCENLDEIKISSLTNTFYSALGFSNKQGNLSEALCSESPETFHRNRSETEQIIEMLVFSIHYRKDTSVILDQVTLSNSSSPDGYITFRNDTFTQCLSLTQIALKEICLCSLLSDTTLCRQITLDTISITNAPAVNRQVVLGWVHDLTIRRTNLNKLIIICKSFIEKLHFKEVTLTENAFCDMFESLTRENNRCCVVFDKITMTEPSASYREIHCVFLNNVTIKQTKLLNIAIVFWPWEGFIHGSRLRLENITLTEGSLHAMEKSARQFYNCVEMELDYDVDTTYSVFSVDKRVVCKSVKQMTIYND